jgi:hypothetical protein
MARIKIALEAQGLELEPQLVATLNVFELARRGQAEVWLDILPQLAGPQDIAATQERGLEYALQELQLILAEQAPRARFEVDSKGSVVAYVG